MLLSFKGLAAIALIAAGVWVPVGLNIRSAASSSVGAQSSVTTPPEANDKVAAAMPALSDSTYASTANTLTTQQALMTGVCRTSPCSWEALFHGR